MKSSNLTIVVYFASIFFLVTLTSVYNQDLFNFLNDTIHIKILIWAEKLIKSFVHRFTIPGTLIIMYVIDLLVTLFFSVDEYYIEEEKRIFVWLGSIAIIGASIVCFYFISQTPFLILFFILFFLALGSMIFIRRMYGHVKFIQSLANFSFSLGDDSFTKHNQMKDLKDLFQRLPYQTKDLSKPDAFNLQTIQPNNKYIVFPMLFRHFLIIGGPGAGKSASVLKPFMENSIVNLGQSSFIYDFKGPELTSLAYHFYKEAKDKYGDNYNMSFRSIDFSNPFKSHRCNPLDPKYMVSMTFAKQVVEVLYKNLNKEQKDDFWSQGAKGYISASIWFLVKLTKKHNINLSNFLNLIYFVNSEYADRIIELMFNDFETQNEMATIYKSRNAENTVGGLLATTSASLSKLNDRSLLFITLEDEIDLNINDPDKPAILCISNKGDDGKDIIYSPIISVFTTILFSKINVKGRRPCSIIIDELPTIILPGLDKLLNTGRSNKLSIMLAMQAYSQLKTGYGDKEADTIKAGCGSIFYGKVMEPEAAKQAHELLGKGEVKKVSRSTGKSSSSTINKELKDILQLSEAYMLPAGGFAGISAGGVLDDSMNDQRFLVRFKYKDYHEDKIAVFPDQFEIEAHDDLSQEELFNQMIDKVIQANIKQLNQIILKEHWSFYFIKYLKDIETQQNISLVPYIESCSSLVLKDDLIAQLEDTLRTSRGKMPQVSYELAKQFVNQKFKKDFLMLGILSESLEEDMSFE